MFFPSDSLRRGGRFYLCWIADSWPWRFSEIPQKQLWSYDIRKICDDLLQMMNCESGCQTNRFSLRLSSQLMRGLVRVFAKKTNLLLGNINRINATVSRNVNKKYAVHIDAPVLTDPQTVETLIRQELHEEDQNLEELLRNSRNVVTNLEDITLKDSAIPEKQLPYDGFGEENPEQPLQMVYDRTIEEMLQQPSTSAAHSGLDLVLDTTERTQDRSRLMAADAVMERISEHDVTVFGRPSDVEARHDIEKDIPEIPEIPPPEVPAPDKEIQEKAPESMDVAEEIPLVTKEKQPVEVEEIELEEIEEEQPRRRRRRANKLIIDKRTKLTSQFYESRIGNIAVELRCEDPQADVIAIRVPWSEYVLRPCHGGERIYSNLGYRLENLFKRKLDTGIERRPLAERELQQAMFRKNGTRTPTKLDTVVEEPETIIERPQIQVQEASEINITRRSVLDVSEARVSVKPMDVDISEMLTQKLETVPQAEVQGKRSTDAELPPPKRPRAIGLKSSRQWKIQNEIDREANKENIPEYPTQYESTEEHQLRELKKLLQQSGLADSECPMLLDVQRTRERIASSYSSETPLGSLDRTKVSLGDSETTTDSRRLVREQWGTVGTVHKVVQLYKRGYYPITVRELIKMGPTVPGMERIIAAKCFISILKLKSRQLLNIEKDSETLEIKHITLGTPLIPVL